jgi:hypothetical protein
MNQIWTNLLQVSIQKIGNQRIIIKMFVRVRRLLPIEIDSPYGNSFVKFVNVTVPVFWTVMPVPATEDMHGVTSFH